MPERFQPFGLLHLATVTIVFGVIAGVVAYARKGPIERAHRLGRGLAIFLLVYYAIETVIRVSVLNVPFAHNLPFEICNALFLIGAFALYTRHPLALEITYLWAFAATLHALITPTPGEGFPSLEYVRYFMAHGLLILVATYAVLALDATITWGSVLRAAIALQLFEIVVAGVNLVLDQNFMYLRRPPPSPTLIDSLGPWPVYLLSLELVGVVSFAIWVAALKGARRVLAPRSAAGDGQTTVA